MIGHLLGDLQLPAVAQVLGDAGGAEAVAADARTDVRGIGAPAHHSENVGLGHGRF